MSGGRYEEDAMTPKVFPIVPASSTVFWVLLAIVLALLALTVLFAGIWYSTRHVRFELTDAGLRIRGGIYGRTIPMDALVVEQARALDLDAEPGYAARMRTNGIGLPGYGEGWFRLKNGKKALMFVTDRSQLIHVPTTKGYELLLTPSRGAEFLAALAACRGG